VFLFTKFALLIVSALAFFHAVSRFINLNDKRLKTARVFDVSFVNSFFLTFVISLICFNQWFSFGREIFSSSILLPGSLLTQFSVFEVSSAIHRLLQPGFWLLFIGIFSASFYSEKKIFFELSNVFLFLLWGLEIYELSSYEKNIPALFANILTVGFFINLALALIFNCTKSNKRSVLSFPIFSFLSLFCFIAFAGIDTFSESPRIFSRKIGAHYYSWFPENWTAGYIGKRSEPQIQPSLGEYQSEDKEVVAQHLLWAEQAKLDFFVYDWWPTRTEVDRRLKKMLLQHDFPKNLQFSLQYESLDVKENDAPAYPGEGKNEVYLNKKRAWRLKKHWEYLAKTYMQDERYLKIDGKAVLFLYASRHFVGPVFEAISEAKKHVLETTGVSLYLVGDEAFYNVLSFSKKKGILLLPTFVPEWSRLVSFDALTAYNPLNPKGGDKSSEEYLEQFSLLYSRYQNISSALGIPFFPTVLPGYNDRGVRPDEKNSIVPRKSISDNFLSASIKETGLPFLDSQVPMLLVTSWNEWNEGTQIEPAVSIAQDSPVDNTEKNAESGQFSYTNYGTQYLNIIRDLSLKNTSR